MAEVSAADLHAPGGTAGQAPGGTAGQAPGGTAGPAPGGTAGPAAGGRSHVGAGGAVHRSVEGGVATLTLDRGGRNTLNGPYADLIAEALDGCRDDPEVRVVVLTGLGRYFCVGADLSLGPASIRIHLVEDRGGAAEYREPAGRVVMAMGRLGKPLIVAVNGDAVGGGATISLAADLRFAADTARFSFPFTRLGVCPEGASTYYLPRLVGLGKASEWLLSGRLIGAEEAERSGLVNRVLPAVDVLPAAQAYARELAVTTSATAVAVTRALLAADAATPVEASDAESREIARLADRPDCLEGVAAFLERRPPRFSDSE
ncbi:MAG TPA: enoyl-CoA hydratase-related protein [Pseudonocardia sp.]|nr:enoyl-CoA hydratase-related protein [Pseudonocardia sp.]